MSERRQLEFRRLHGAYVVLRFPPDTEIPAWVEKVEFTSVTRTGEELSIVCPLENVPDEIASGPRWICLKLQGPFPFSQTGVLLSFIEPLSSRGIPIFAISTFDTDYVLVQEKFEEIAVENLRQAGHRLAS